MHRFTTLRLPAVYPREWHQILQKFAALRLPAVNRRNWTKSCKKTKKRLTISGLVKSAEMLAPLVGGVMVMFDILQSIRFFIRQQSHAAKRSEQLVETWNVVPGLQGNPIQGSS